MSRRGSGAGAPALSEVKSSRYILLAGPVLAACDPRSLHELLRGVEVWCDVSLFFTFSNYD
jgi:hypothetical protein